MTHYNCCTSRFYPHNTCYSNNQSSNFYSNQYSVPINFQNSFGYRPPIYNPTPLPIYSYQVNNFVNAVNTLNQNRRI